MTEFQGFLSAAEELRIRGLSDRGQSAGGEMHQRSQNKHQGIKRGRSSMNVDGSESKKVKHLGNDASDMVLTPDIEDYDEDGHGMANDDFGDFDPAAHAQANYENLFESPNTTPSG